MAKEIEKEKVVDKKAELLAIIEAYKIANPIKAAQKKEEFEKKLKAF